MGCEYEERDEVIVDYVEGSLTGDAREAFEAHYFGCDRCFAQLQMTEKLIGTMLQHGEKVFARFHEQPATSPGKASKTPSLEDTAVNWIGRLELVLLRRKHLAGLMALALIVLVVGGWVVRYFIFPPDYQKLAVVEPSPWPMVTPLGEAADALVDQARQQYLKREYRGAISALAQAVHIYPSIASLEYILGVCYFFAHDTDAAVDHLTHALNLKPDLEAARWYLAHAYLKRREREMAIDNLAWLVQNKSVDYAEPAREILKAIDPFYFLGRGF